MLEPLDRCRRDSTLFQFTSKRLRDFIDPNHLLIQIGEQMDFAKLVTPLEKRHRPGFGRPAVHPEVIKASDTLTVACYGGLLVDENEGLAVTGFSSIIYPDYPDHVSTAITADKQITLTFDEALASATASSLLNAFVYRIDGGDWKKVTGAIFNEGRDQITLTIGDSLSACDWAQVAYGGGPLEDLHGLKVTGFTTNIYPDPPEHVSTAISGDKTITLTSARR